MKNAILCTFMAVMSLSPAANAQIEFGTSDEPIHVAAEKATYKGNVTVLHNKVNVRQGESRIQSDEMEIYRAVPEGEASENGDPLRLGAVTKIIAKGNFRYVTPETTVTGGQGIYYRERGVFVVTDNVRVKQPNGSFVTGDKMVYDLENGRVKFGEECKKEPCDGRVSVRLNQ